MIQLDSLTRSPTMNSFSSQREEQSPSVWSAWRNLDRFKPSSTNTSVLRERTAREQINPILMIPGKGKRQLPQIKIFSNSSQTSPVSDVPFKRDWRVREESSASIWEIFQGTVETTFSQTGESLSEERRNHLAPLEKPLKRRGRKYFSQIPGSVQHQDLCTRL